MLNVGLHFSDYFEMCGVKIIHYFCIGTVCDAR